MLELKSDAQVLLKRILIGGRDVVAYCSDTKNEQIGLYLYDENSGNFIAIKHYGYANPYQAGSLLQTADGGLVIIGTTYLAGRFSRIVLIKLSQKELGKIVP
jgi:hypothetical protein